MLAHAIAAADHDGLARHLRAQQVQVVGRLVGRADIRVAQHDHISVAAHGAHGVGQVFALVDGRELDAVAGRHDFAAQVTHRRLEGEVGARAGFVEQRGHQPPGGELEQAAVVLGEALADRDRGVEQDLQVAPAKLLDRDDVFAGEVAIDLGRRVQGQKPFRLA